MGPRKTILALSAVVPRIVQMILVFLLALVVLRRNDDKEIAFYAIFTAYYSAMCNIILADTNVLYVVGKLKYRSVWMHLYLSVGISIVAAAIYLLFLAASGFESSYLYIVAFYCVYRISEVVFISFAARIRKTAEITDYTYYEMIKSIADLGFVLIILANVPPVFVSIASVPAYIIINVIVFKKYNRAMPMTRIGLKDTARMGYILLARVESLSLRTLLISLFSVQQFANIYPGLMIGMASVSMVTTVTSLYIRRIDDFIRKSAVNLIYVSLAAATVIIVFLISSFSAYAVMIFGGANVSTTAVWIGTLSATVAYIKYMSRLRISIGSGSYRVYTFMFTLILIKIFLAALLYFIANDIEIFTYLLLFGEGIFCAILAASALTSRGNNAKGQSPS